MAVENVRESPGRHRGAPKEQILPGISQAQYRTDEVTLESRAEAEGGSVLTDGENRAGHPGR